MVIYVIFWHIYYFFNTYKLIGWTFYAWKCWQMCHYIELSEYKLYMGHIHTLVLTREWIAMLHQRKNVDGKLVFPSRCGLEHSDAEQASLWKSKSTRVVS